MSLFYKVPSSSASLLLSIFGQTSVTSVHDSCDLSYVDLVASTYYTSSVAPSDFDSENFCSEIPNGIGKATEFRSEFRFFFKFRKKSSENIFRNINRNSEFCYNSEKIPKIPHILHSFDNVFNIKWSIMLKRRVYIYLFY